MTLATSTKCPCLVPQTAYSWEETRFLGKKSFLSSFWQCLRIVTSSGLPGNWDFLPKFRFIHNRPAMSQMVSFYTSGSLWSDSSGHSSAVVPKKGIRLDSCGRQEQKLLLWPLIMAMGHQRDITRRGFPGGKFQTLHHTRNSGSKAILKGNRRRSVRVPSRLLQGKEISGISLWTSMLSSSWLQKDIRGNCFQRPSL